MTLPQLIACASLDADRSSAIDAKAWTAEDALLSRLRDMSTPLEKASSTMGYVRASSSSTTPVAAPEGTQGSENPGASQGLTAQLANGWPHPDSALVTGKNGSCVAPAAAEDRELCKAFLKRNNDIRVRLWSKILNMMSLVDQCRSLVSSEGEDDDEMSVNETARIEEQVVKLRQFSTDWKRALQQLEAVYDEGLELHLELWQQCTEVSTMKLAMSFAKDVPDLLEKWRKATSP